MVGVDRPDRGELARSTDLAYPADLMGPDATPTDAAAVRDALMGADYADTDQVSPDDWAALPEQVEVHAAVAAADAAIAESIAMGGVVVRRYSAALNDELEVRATGGAETAARCEYWGVTPEGNAWRVRLAVRDQTAGRRYQCSKQLDVLLHRYSRRHNRFGDNDSCITERIRSSQHGPPKRLLWPSLVRITNHSCHPRDPLRLGRTGYGGGPASPFLSAKRSPPSVRSGCSAPAMAFIPGKCASGLDFPLGSPRSGHGSNQRSPEARATWWV